MLIQNSSLLFRALMLVSLCSCGQATSTQNVYGSATSNKIDTSDIRLQVAGATVLEDGALEVHVDLINESVLSFCVSSGRLAGLQTHVVDRTTLYYLFDQELDDPIDPSLANSNETSAPSELAHVVVPSGEKLELVHRLDPIQNAYFVDEQFVAKPRSIDLRNLRVLAIIPILSCEEKTVEAALRSGNYTEIRSQLSEINGKLDAFVRRPLR